jgi:hypothetical protein
MTGGITRCFYLTNFSSFLVVPPIVPPESRIKPKETSFA